MPRLRLALLLLAWVFPQPANAGELEDRFLLAVRTGDVAGVKAALGAGANVNTKFRYDRMALSFAADRGNPEVVKVLLDAGADVNARDTFYGMDAMSQALSKKHTAIVRMLLEKGAANGEGVLMFGVQQNSLELATASLEKGGLRADSLTRAIARASKDNRSELVDLLKKHGATPPFAVEAVLLDQYAGSYKAENNPDLKFQRQSSTLEAVFSGQTFALIALSADTFRAEQFEGITLQFESEAGRVVGAKLTQGKNETRYKKVEATP
ncbi:MAG TPA: ankyrin repeat domain-containing protein [Terriglobia bacterium]|nr:ankyrin repeat domain-containing protein [Terriglobia bacterium]